MPVLVDALSQLPRTRETDDAAPQTGPSKVSGSAVTAGGPAMAGFGDGQAGVQPRGATAAASELQNPMIEGDMRDVDAWVRPGTGTASGAAAAGQGVAGGDEVLGGRPEQSPTEVDADDAGYEEDVESADGRGSEAGAAHGPLPEVAASSPVRPHPSGAGGGVLKRPLAKRGRRCDVIIRTQSDNAMGLQPQTSPLHARGDFSRGPLSEDDTPSTSAAAPDGLDRAPRRSALSESEESAPGDDVRGAGDSEGSDDELSSGEEDEEDDDDDEADEADEADEEEVPGVSFNEARRAPVDALPPRSLPPPLPLISSVSGPRRHKVVALGADGRPVRHVRHIRYVPAKAEPAGDVARTRAVGAVHIRLQNALLAGTAPSPSLRRVFDVINPENGREGEDVVPPPLSFDSAFESGNLRAASLVRGRYPANLVAADAAEAEAEGLLRPVDAEYDLQLRADLHTKGNTQWFYFAVRGTRSGERVRMNVCNLLKPDSLYNYGMKPVVYSEQEAQRTGLGWHRAGDDVCYFRNAQMASQRRTRPTYSLSFTYTFAHEGDTVYFAHCFPYTYTELVEDLDALEGDPERRACMRRRTLATTLAGNACEMVTVTATTRDPAELAERRGVVFTARVHPGETNSSWMMRGLLFFLTGPSREAETLRRQFVFRIVPMLNPDGVIQGNYRCSLAGCDLNRRYLRAAADLHPVISTAKRMVCEFQRQREVVLYADLHGHSRKKNVFCYGCARKDDPLDARVRSRLLAYLMHRLSPACTGKGSFSFRDCAFSISRSKAGCGRIVMWREAGVPNALTVEASFFGAGDNAAILSKAGRERMIAAATSGGRNAAQTPSANASTPTSRSQSRGSEEPGASEDGSARTRQEAGAPAGGQRPPRAPRKGGASDKARSSKGGSRTRLGLLAEPLAEEGGESGVVRERHFDVRDLERVGRTIVHALAAYVGVEPDPRAEGGGSESEPALDTQPSDEEEAVGAAAAGEGGDAAPRVPQAVEGQRRPHEPAPTYSAALTAAAKGIPGLPIPQLPLPPPAWCVRELTGVPMRGVLAPDTAANSAVVCGMALASSDRPEDGDSDAANSTSGAVPPTPTGGGNSSRAGSDSESENRAKVVVEARPRRRRRRDPLGPFEGVPCAGRPHEDASGPFACNAVLPTTARNAERWAQHAALGEDTLCHDAEPGAEVPLFACSKATAPLSRGTASALRLRADAELVLHRYFASRQVVEARALHKGRMLAAGATEEQVASSLKDSVRQEVEALRSVLGRGALADLVLGSTAEPGKGGRGGSGGGGHVKMVREGEAAAHSGGHAGVSAQPGAVEGDGSGGGGSSSRGSSRPASRDSVSFLGHLLGDALDDDDVAALERRVMHRAGASSGGGGDDGSGTGGEEEEEEEDYGSDSEPEAFEADEGDVRRSKLFRSLTKKRRLRQQQNGEVIDPAVAAAEEAAARAAKEEERRRRRAKRRKAERAASGSAGPGAGVSGAGLPTKAESTLLFRQSASLRARGPAFRTGTRATARRMLSEHKAQARREATRTAGGRRTGPGGVPNRRKSTGGGSGGGGASRMWGRAASAKVREHRSGADSRFPRGPDLRPSVVGSRLSGHALTTEDSASDTGGRPQEPLSSHAPAGPRRRRPGSRTRPPMPLTAPDSAYGHSSATAPPTGAMEQAAVAAAAAHRRGAGASGDVAMLATRPQSALPAPVTPLGAPGGPVEQGAATSFSSQDGAAAAAAVAAVATSALSGRSAKGGTAAAPLQAPPPSQAPPPPPEWMQASKRLVRARQESLAGAGQPLVRPGSTPARGSGEVGMGPEPCPAAPPPRSRPPPRRHSATRPAAAEGWADTGPAAASYEGPARMAAPGGGPGAATPNAAARAGVRTMAAGQDHSAPAFVSSQHPSWGMVGRGVGGRTGVNGPRRPPSRAPVPRPLHQAQHPHPGPPAASTAATHPPFASAQGEVTAATTAAAETAPARPHPSLEAAHTHTHTQAQMGQAIGLDGPHPFPLAFRSGGPPAGGAGTPLPPAGPAVPADCPLHRLEGGEAGSEALPPAVGAESGWSGTSPRSERGQEWPSPRSATESPPREAPAGSLLPGYAESARRADATSARASRAGTATRTRRHSDRVPWRRVGTEGGGAGGSNWRGQRRHGLSSTPSVGDLRRATLVGVERGVRPAVEGTTSLPGSPTGPRSLAAPAPSGWGTRKEGAQASNGRAMSRKGHPPPAHDAESERRTWQQGDPEAMGGAAVSAASSSPTPQQQQQQQQGVSMRHSPVRTGAAGGGYGGPAVVMAPLGHFGGAAGPSLPSSVRVRDHLDPRARPPRRNSGSAPGTARGASDRSRPSAAAGSGQAAQGAGAGAVRQRTRVFPVEFPSERRLPPSGGADPGAWRGGGGLVTAPTFELGSEDGGLAARTRELPPHIARMIQGVRQQGSNNSARLSTAGRVALDKSGSTSRGR